MHQCGPWTVMTDPHVDGRIVRASKRCRLVLEIDSGEISIVLYAWPCRHLWSDSQWSYMQTQKRLSGTKLVVCTGMACCSTLNQALPV